MTFESGRLKSCAVTEETGVNLRVLADGRMGVAGTTADDADDLVARAVASAALGESVPIAFPARRPSPTSPRTRHPRPTRRSSGSPRSAPSWSAA